MRRVLSQVPMTALMAVVALITLAFGMVGVQAASDIVLYASEAPVKSGWNVVADSTAAGGARLANPNLGASQITDTLATPSKYFEMSFDAQSGVGYRLWVRR